MRLHDHRVDDLLGRRRRSGEHLRPVHAQVFERQPQWLVIDVQRDQQGVVTVAGPVNVMAIVQPQRGGRRGV